MYSVSQFFQHSLCHQNTIQYDVIKSYPVEPMKKNYTTSNSNQFSLREQIRSISFTAYISSVHQTLTEYRDLSLLINGMSMMNKVTLWSPSPHNLRSAIFWNVLINIPLDMFTQCNGSKIKIKWFILEIQRYLLVGNGISLDSWKVRQIGEVNDGEDTAV